MSEIIFPTLFAGMKKNDLTKCQAGKKTSVFALQIYPLRYFLFSMQ